MDEKEITISLDEETGVKIISLDEEIGVKILMYI